MKYKVFWNTQPSPGATYYSGEEIVKIEEDELEEGEEYIRRVAVNRVWLRSFREYHKSHIKVSKVVEVK